MKSSNLKDKQIRLKKKADARPESKLGPDTTRRKLTTWWKKHFSKLVSVADWSEKRGLEYSLDQLTLLENVAANIEYASGKTRVSGYTATWTKRVNEDGTRTLLFRPRTIRKAWASIGGAKDSSDRFAAGCELLATHSHLGMHAEYESVEDFCAKEGQKLTAKEAEQYLYYLNRVTSGVLLIAGALEEFDRKYVIVGWYDFFPYPYIVAVIGTTAQREEYEAAGMNE